MAAKYPVGTHVRGRVVSLTDYGAFVELEPGVEGLVHVSEMSWHEARHPVIAWCRWAIRSKRPS